MSVCCCHGRRSGGEESFKDVVKTAGYMLPNSFQILQGRDAESVSGYQNRERDRYMIPVSATL